MALTKVTKTGITDNAIDGDKIEDGTVVAADIAPGTISSDKIATGTIANDKLANSSVTINNSAVSLGGSIELATGTDWQAVTVADGSTTLNAEAGKGYFLDTNAGVIEVFLPSSPARGDKVILADYSGTFGTNQIIINTGGELLDSTAGNDFKVTTNNAIVELIYVDSAKGWLVKINQAAGTTPDSALTDGVYDTDFQGISATGGTVTDSGNYRIHTFTGDGCFVVSALGSGGPSDENTKVSYLVVAGGGGNYGTSGVGSGGAGAGGFREGKVGSDTYCASPIVAPDGLTVTTTTYPISVGAGGSGASNGSPSTFSTITSAGGGYGNTRAGHPSGGGGPGNPGGSGGGAGDFGSGPGGNGNTPPTSPSQGFPGFAGSPGEAAGGGGGATSGGPTGTQSAVPGLGAQTSISGSAVTHAAGGDGEGPGNTNASAPIRNAGGGGMGSGGTFPGSPNPTAQAKTGIVVIRYKLTN